MQRPQDILARYKAARAELRFPDEVQQLSGEGGGLAGAVDALGVAPLAGLLYARPALQGLSLEDAGVSLSLRRAGGGAELEVSWASGEALRSRVELEPHPDIGAAAHGPMLRPDAASRYPDAASALRASGPVLVVEEPDGALGFYASGRHGDGVGARALKASLPAAGALGPAAFRDAMGLTENYIAGAMAGGVGSAAIVIAMGRAGMLGFFGAGGLPVEAVREALVEVKRALGDKPAGFNLLHNPVEPEVEERTVDLYLEHGVRYLSASAYMRLTPAIVRYRYKGARRDASGQIHCPNRVFAKISHPVVARQFLEPAPAALIDELTASGGLTAAEAEIAAVWPMCDAMTCEADSGGHTDRRPLPVLLPLMRRLREQISAERGYAGLGARIFIGAAGGVGTPEAARAALSMGADYLLTGSVNQATREAGTSDMVKELLTQAGMSDTAMGPAPDMFEIGAEVQVLSRGTMYAQRARRLHEAYKRYGAWEELDVKEAAKIEKTILGRSFGDIWADCEAYWGQRNPKQLQKAERDPKHKMALVFRWYLGMTSRWARAGDSERKRDFQVWCGPSMGAFNDWVAGTELEPLARRGVVEVAHALLSGARTLGRAEALEAQGVALPMADVLAAARPRVAAS